MIALPVRRTLPWIAALAWLGASLPAAQEGAQEQEKLPAEATPAAPAPATAETRRHLFLYLIDGLGALEMTAFGYPVMTTPNLVGMMGEGVTYLNEYTVSPWTAPAVAALFTSLYPSALGVHKAGDRLPASARTLAEVLKESGYQTALFSSHPLVGPLSGLDQGFDWVEEVQGPFGPKPPRGPAETSATLNRRVLDWLDRRGSTAPLFVTVVSSDPMQPFGAPDPEGSRFIEPKELEWYRALRGRLLESRPGPLSLATTGDLKRLKADATRFAAAARKVYDGAILYNDNQMWLLREALESRGFLKSTLFAVTSTHGQELLEHGAFGHGTSLYDVSIRVPLVLTCPDLIPRANQVRDMADHVDLMPTLLSLLGVPVPEGVQGIERNISPTPDSRIFYERPAFAEARPAGALDTGILSMVVESGTKFIENEAPPAGVQRPAVELYRRVDGPQDWDRKNMAGGMPRVMAHAREVLALWKERTAERRLPADAAPAARDPRLKEVLRSLGYLQGSTAKAGQPAKSGGGSKAAPSDRP